jgi:hypothetical protein
MPRFSALVSETFNFSTVYKEAGLKMNSFNGLRRGLASVIYLCLAATVLFAQGTGASLNGSISDTEGGFLPGTRLTIQNLDTNLTRIVTTNETGQYSVAPLPPGRYSVTAEKDGFKKEVRSGIVLTVGQTATLNINLQIGEAKEVVTVAAGAELVNATSAEISQVVAENAIKELPLNGRDPSSLVLLSPGVTNVLNTGGGTRQGETTFPNESGASAGGGRQGSTYYLLDGVPNMDTYLLLAAPFPNADATQEFRVISNNFDAHYGFAPGAIVSIETKSGTNDFHGGAFEFLRNNKLNAGNFFTHAVDPLKRNQFGGYFGGPIIKQKLFFFGNYQATRATTTASTNVTYTPTTAMLNGDFSAIPQTLGGPFHAVNGKPNQVSPSLFSPAAVAIATTALPRGETPSSGQVNYVGAPTAYDYNEGTGRIDWNLSQAHRLSFRNFIQFYDQPGQVNNGNILSVVPGKIGRYYNEGLNHTWTVNASTVNVLSLFWTQMYVSNGSPVKDSQGNDFCLSQYISAPEQGCFVEGLSASNGFGSSWTEPTSEMRKTWGLSDGLSKTIGNHTLAFGGDAWHQFAQENSNYPSNPIVSFNGNYTGYGLSDFLLGNVGQYTQGAGEIASVSGWQIGVYAQDQWKAKPNLTLTFGLRWDPNLPPAAYGGRGSAFRPGQQSTRFPNAPLGMVFPGDRGVSDALMPTSYNYYEPRVGIAYQPKGMPHTSLRAGFGMFTAPLPYSAYNHTADISPFSPTYVMNGSPSNPISFENPWANFAGTGGASPFPPFASLGYQPPQNSVILSPVQLGAIFSNNFKLGMTQSWNASIDQQFGSTWAAHLAYVGSESYHQAVILDQNPGYSSVRTQYPAFSGILTDASVGTASYNSLQVGVEKRFSHGIQFQSNYTYSKTIDTASSGNISFSGGLPNPNDLGFSRGISDLSFPHIWTTNFSYTTPALKNWNPFVRQVFGDWGLSGIWTLQSGRPFSISGGSGNNHSGSLQYGDRADLTGQPIEQQQGSKQQWLNRYFNTAAFTTNPVGTFGNSGRNILRGPRYNSIDLAFLKNWNVRERYGLQFRWEMFNALNHASFGTPVNDPSSSNFGQITSIGPIAPRVMQGALKLTF